MAPVFVIFSEKHSFSFLFQFLLKTFSGEKSKVRVHSISFLFQFLLKKNSDAKSKVRVRVGVTLRYDYDYDYDYVTVHPLGPKIQ